MANEYTSPALAAALDALQARGGIVRPVRVSLGGCAEAINTERQGAMRRSAHAHTAKDNYMRGWICFKSAKPEVLTTATGQPSRILAHEWAHMAVLGGHSARWRALMVKLGHKADADRYTRRGNVRRARWVTLDPPLHVNDPEVKRLMAAVPAGHHWDAWYQSEMKADGTGWIVGGGHGFVTKYRYVQEG